MPPVSGVIITRNEASNIARTIRSLAPADEVLVVDSGSSDETCQIAEKLGARVISHAWEGFARQKNFAASEARHDWIVSLDGDEEFNPEAQAAIEYWKASEPACPGYRFARRAQYLGRWIRHSGWYPDYKVRLYHRAQGQWKGDFVHESVEVIGGVRTLGGAILHYTCDSIEDHRRRIEYYTGLAAAEMVKRGAHPGPVLRYTAPWWAFLQSYFVRLGVLDGIPGLWIARMARLYVERKYAKWEDLTRGSQHAR